MRPRIVLPVLAFGLLVAIAAWLLRPGQGGPTVPNPPMPTVTAPAEQLARHPNPKPVAAAPPLVRPAPDSNAPGMDSPEARQQGYVQERIDQLMDLALDDQPASLEVILSELTNRDPDIRQAAVQAAMQFGSREAIPKLKEAADQTEDVHEKAVIQEAIEFLEFPNPADVAVGRPDAAASVRPRPAPQK